MAGVIVAGGLMWLLTVLISNRTVTPRGPFSAEDFEVGDTGRLLKLVPFLLPDASPARSRDIYVQHLGDDEREGWLVFSAFAPGQDDRTCFLRWNADTGRFRDPCTEETFPADGDGLTHYPTTVDEDDRLHVDFSP
jgi:hypothetical protein